jgi:chondroitin 4-sulfotransferase 11
MIKKLLRKYHIWKHAKSQNKKVFNEGTLLNAFYKSKTIFIHIPKTAGVSLAKAIYGDVTLEGHRSFYFNSIALNIKNEVYFSFSFVRNPFDRLYSAYKFLNEGGMNHLDKLAFQTHLSEFEDFEDFILNGLNKKLIYQITHFIPQHEYLCDKSGSILVDFIGRFENLDKDILLLSEKLNKNIELNHHNYNNKSDYKEVYTDEMIYKVNQIYQKDIDIFKYTFK